MHLAQSLTGGLQIEFHLADTCDERQVSKPYNNDVQAMKVDGMSSWTVRP